MPRKKQAQTPAASLGYLARVDKKSKWGVIIDQAQAQRAQRA